MFHGFSYESCQFIVSWECCVAAWRVDEKHFHVRYVSIELLNLGAIYLRSKDKNLKPQQRQGAKANTRFFDAQTIVESRAYQKAARIAQQYQHDSARLNQLIGQARSKAQSGIGERYSDMREGLYTLLRLLKVYANGEYRLVPWKSLSVIIVSVVYFVMPLDVIPDFLATLGLLDDGVLIAWTLKFVKDDLDSFRLWERENANKKQETVSKSDKVDGMR